MIQVVQQARFACVINDPGFKYFLLIKKVIKPKALIACISETYGKIKIFIIYWPAGNTMAFSGWLYLHLLPFRCINKFEL